ncbi:MAG: M15 family metallopeptidase [Lachnospiraceae bacterium]|nr:M15 family metallopeptidase [Lachnospiraceae bacterium]
MICAFLAQYLIGAETLEEYAKNNPELAYGPRTEADDTNDTANVKDTTVEDAGNPATDTVDNSSVYNKTDTASAAQSENNNTGLPSSDMTQPETESSDLQSEKENDDMNVNPERITYKPGFYYEPLNETIKQRITGISYPVTESLADKTAIPSVNMIADDTVPAVSYDDLRYVRVLHYDFDDREKEGELICNKAIAEDMVEIFYELYQSDYQIEQIRLVDEYSGDDTLSMMDNNTSCFNYRVVDGTDSLSKHAYGLAIDINPFYNPYIVFGRNEDGSDYISPKGSEVYADRSQNFAYKIDENDLCYRLFKEHGFTWGGDWNSCKDYQHFQKAIE